MSIEEFMNRFGPEDWRGAIAISLILASCYLWTIGQEVGAAAVFGVFATTVAQYVYAKGE